MTKEICSVAECNEKSSCKGMCNKHYRRARKSLSKAKAQTKTYMLWAAMRQRCSNPNSKGFKNYGGRGIFVCNRWSSYKNFLHDMGEKPEGLSLDRVDNDGPYSRENCRWATHIEQANNRRKRQTLYETGISRRKYGYSVSLKNVYIGHRKTLEDAVLLRDRHENANHGRAAKC